MSASRELSLMLRETRAARNITSALQDRSGRPQAAEQALEVMESLSRAIALFAVAATSDTWTEHTLAAFQKANQTLEQLRSAITALLTASALR